MVKPGVAGSQGESGRPGLPGADGPMGPKGEVTTSPMSCDPYVQHIYCVFSSLFTSGAGGEPGVSGSHGEHASSRHFQILSVLLTDVYQIC